MRRLLPFGVMFEVYAKLGAAFSEGESVQRLDQSFGDQVVTRSVSDSGTDIVWGLGAGVTVAKVFHVRLGFESVGIDEDVLNTRSDTSRPAVSATLAKIASRSSLNPEAHRRARP